MEPFVDGGLFELLIIIGIGFMINFIFLNKYLLTFYSILSLAAPVWLALSLNDELHYILCAFCFFNSILLNILLWRQRIINPKTPLFDITKYRKKFFKKDPTPGN